MIKKQVSSIVKYKGYVDYKDRNERNRRYESFGESRLFVPIDQMEPGDYINITVIGDNKKELKSAIKTLSSHMTLVGGYLGVFIKHQILSENEKTAILKVTHDGWRNKQKRA